MTHWLIGVLIGVFVIQSLLWFYWDADISKQLELTTKGVFSGKVWQLVTFQFLHTFPSPWHVLFNCLGLWFFGRRVEEVLGSRRFLKVYFACGLAGGMLQVLLPVILPRHDDVAVVGASAGVCGIIAVFCSLYPMQELTTWLYFFPIQIRARYLLIFLGAFSLFGTLIPLGPVAYGAHLGGILFGIGYVRWRVKFSDWLDRVRGRREVGLRCEQSLVRREGCGGERQRPLARVVAKHLSAVKLIRF
jgi:membrane associated rhomboid family serine protease